MTTKEEVLEALKRVQDPEQHRDIVSLGRIQNLTLEGATVRFDYVLPSLKTPFRGLMEAEAKKAVEGLSGVSSVEIAMREAGRQSGAPRGNRPLPKVRHVVAVGSGKGGVGKSTVAVNLAVSLAKAGKKVGLMDADVYGPNQPQMLGIESFNLQPDAQNKIAPAEAHGVKLISMGFLIQPDQAVVWRGPMLHGAVNQFLTDVLWGELDYLLVDLPPGTGDVQISLCQSTPLRGSVIVTTPQSIAVSDVRKAVSMFNKLNVPVLGVVENMAQFVAPDTGKSYRIFGEGGAKSLCERFNLDLLASLPLEPAVCEGGEKGAPVALARPDSPTAKAFADLATNLDQAAEAALKKQPDLKIETV